MWVTVTGTVSKMCPYKDEQDVGTISMTFDVYDDGDIPELHELGAYLHSGLTGSRLSHEAYTREVFATYEPMGLVRIQTNWRTAGLGVSVAIPDRPR